jgi:hypothetical protein
MFEISVVCTSLEIVILKNVVNICGQRHYTTLKTVILKNILNICVPTFCKSMKTKMFKIMINNCSSSLAIPLKNIRNIRRPTVCTPLRKHITSTSLWTCTLLRVCYIVYGRSWLQKVIDFHGLLFHSNLHLFQELLLHRYTTTSLAPLVKIPSLLWTRGLMVRKTPDRIVTIDGMVDEAVSTELLQILS